MSWKKGGIHAVIITIYTILRNLIVSYVEILLDIFMYYFDPLVYSYRRIIEYKNAAIRGGTTLRNKMEYWTEKAVGFLIDFTFQVLFLWHIYSILFTYWYLVLPILNTSYVQSTTFYFLLQIIKQDIDIALRKYYIIYRRYTLPFTDPIHEYIDPYTHKSQLGLKIRRQKWVFYYYLKSFQVCFLFFFSSIVVAWICTLTVAWILDIDFIGTILHDLRILNRTFFSWSIPKGGVFEMEYYYDSWKQFLEITIIGYPIYAYNSIYMWFLTGFIQIGEDLPWVNYHKAIMRGNGERYSHIRWLFAWILNVTYWFSQMWVFYIFTLLA